MYWYQQEGEVQDTSLHLPDQKQNKNKGKKQLYSYSQVKTVLRGAPGYSQESTATQWSKKPEDNPTKIIAEERPWLKHKK